MGFILRYFYLLAALLAMVALPYTAREAYHAYVKYNGTKEIYQAYQRYRTSYEGYKSEVKRYKAFKRDVGLFTRATHRARITKHFWIPYKLDFMNRMVSIRDMKTLLSSAQHGSAQQGGSYYYEPRMFEVKRLGTAAGGGAQLLQTLEKKSGAVVEPGSRVLLSMKGTYLVFHHK
ncbi:MAG: hypothetical protein HQL50_10980 [Magnetococcales bacterium]|nr:hypothetical protein [Magnetococcales bacterium]